MAKRNRRQKSKKMQVVNVVKSKKRRSNRRRPRKTLNFGISECAARYAVAIADPWNPAARGACVPMHPSRPSQKVTAYREIIVSIGTSGYGFIMLSPCLSNDKSCIFSSNSSFAASTVSVSVDSPQAGTKDWFLTNIPYSGSQLYDSTQYGKPKVMGRLVSAAISAEYTGTELNRGGNIICFVDPDHHSVNNIAFDDLISRAEADIGVPDSNRTKCWVTAFGTDDQELDYPDYSYKVNTLNELTLLTSYPYSKGIPLAPTGNTDPGIGTPMMIIIFTGAPGNTYRCKVVEHLEYIGVGTDFALTPNHTDARGFEIVQSAANMLPSKKAARPKVPLKLLMKEALVESARSLVSNVASAAGTALLATLA